MLPRLAPNIAALTWGMAACSITGKPAHGCMLLNECGRRQETCAVVFAFISKFAFIVLYCLGVRMNDVTARTNRCDGFSEEQWLTIATIQQSFDVEFTQEELNAITTVQALHDVLLFKLGAQETEKCLSAATFYKVRRALTDISGAPSETITPQARLAELLPVRQRRKKWQQLEDALNRTMPSLVYPNVVIIISAVLACLSLRPVAHSFSAGWTQDFGPDFFPRYVHSPGSPAWLSWTMAVFIAFSAFVVLLYWLLRPLAFKFQHGCETAGELVKCIVALNFKIIADSVGGWNERELYESLALVIAGGSGIPLEQVRPETPFPPC